MSIFVNTAKAWLRHGLVRSGVYGVVKRVRSASHMRHMAHADVRSRFETIYRVGEWGNGDVPGSGVGSTLAATEGLRAQLPALLDSLGAETLLDIGCGDFNWMQHVKLHQRYIGVDVVRDVIAENQLRFGKERREFVLANGIEDELPAADVVLCREVLFHLSLADARALLDNVLSSPRRFLIATSDGETLFNADIPSGDWRPLNLRAAPFRFPNPKISVADSVVSAHRTLGVWDASELH